MTHLPLNSQESGGAHESMEPPTVASQDIRMLLAAAANGNESAATELVRRYEPEIRRYIRFRLTDPQMFRLLDSVDITQSVFANFFARLAEDRLRVESSEQLSKLLAVMARNRLLDHVRRGKTLRRATPTGELDVALLPDRQSTSPLEVICANDLIQAITNELSTDDRMMLNQRLLGKDWQELTAEFGSTPDGLRKRCSRAVERAVQRLGLVEVADE